MKRLDEVAEEQKRQRVINGGVAGECLGKLVGEHRGQLNLVN